MCDKVAEIVKESDEKNTVLKTMSLRVRIKNSVIRSLKNENKALENELKEWKLKAQDSEQEGKALKKELEESKAKIEKVT